MPERAARFWTNRIVKFAASLLAVWLVLSVALFVVMCQPPIVFDHVMAKMPPLAFFVLPFETLWLQARRGSLRIGDTAPDFTLKTSDRSSEVSLSSFRGQEPVVLIFGSHT
jgi:AhpC/TSA family